MEWLEDEYAIRFGKVNLKNYHVHYIYIYVVLQKTILTSRKNKVYNQIRIISKKIPYFAYLN